MSSVLPASIWFWVSVFVVSARKSERDLCASAEDSSSSLISKELSVQLELDSNNSKRSQNGAWFQRTQNGAWFQRLVHHYHQRRRLGCGSGFFFPPFGSHPLCSIGVLCLFLSLFWLRFLSLGLVVDLLFESILGARTLWVDFRFRERGPGEL